MIQSKLLWLWIDASRYLLTAVSAALELKQKLIRVFFLLLRAKSLITRVEYKQNLFSWDLRLLDIDSITESFRLMTHIFSPQLHFVVVELLEIDDQSTTEKKNYERSFRRFQKYFFNVPEQEYLPNYLTVSPMKLILTRYSSIKLSNL